MSDPIYFAPIRVPLIDARTGIMTREWYLFFQGLWQRSGGSIAPGTQDLEQGIGEGLGDGELAAMILQSSDAAQLVMIAELQAQLAEVRKEVDALKQGPVM